MNRPRRTLVTGAGGFVGSHLVEHLVRDGHRVRAFVHYNSANHWNHLEQLDPTIRDALEILPGDVTDPFSVDRAVDGCDIVFHLAALIAIPYSYHAPASYVATNITGTLNMLQACRRHDVTRLVHTSTSETYGSAQYVPIDERHPLVGQSPYSASKIAADKLAESYHCSYNLPVVTVRPFNTYGPRQSARAVIPTIICQALAREGIRLGSLSPVRDLTFVTDTVAGFIAAAQADAAIGQVINLGTGQGVSIAALVELIQQLLGTDWPVRTDPQRVRPAASEVLRLVCDNRRARELLDWHPTVDLETGLTEVIDWIRTHPELYKAEIYNV